MPATIPNSEIKDLEKQKFMLDGSGDVAVRTNLTVEDIEIGKVEIKNSTDDTTSTVKATGTTSEQGLVMIDAVANSLVPSVYDYIGVTYPTTSSEVYTFKKGGSGGTTVSTLTLAFSDAVTKQILTSATKT